MPTELSKSRRLLLALAAVLALNTGLCRGMAVITEPPDAALTTHTLHLDDGSYIRGYRRAITGRQVWHFLGVPFAKPPVGPLRFRAPEPLGAPLGDERNPFDAFQKPRSCFYWPTLPQDFEKVNPALMMWWNNTEMSEDCLYLNLWTPTMSTLDTKAIMIWIFGGGFFGGSASLEIYDGAVLASKGDVVVASMQYRTGAFGFLHLDEDEAPGNMGLMDQRLAMKWIHENAIKFGGDPSRITLFGESAGAVSVSLHMLNRDSGRYFSRAILNSGSALAWWATEDRAKARYRAKNLADRVGCYTADGDRKRIVECLRHVSPDNIQSKLFDILMLANDERLNKFREYRRRIGKFKVDRNDNPSLFFDLPFRPVYGTPFIPEDPHIAAHKGNMKKADLLLGVVKDEGIFWIVYALSQWFVATSTHQWYLPFWWGKQMNAIERQTLREMEQKAYVERDPYQLVARYFIASQNMNSLLMDAVSFEYQVPSSRHGFDRWSSRDAADAFDDLTGDKTFKCPVIDFAEFYLGFLEQQASLSHKVWMYSFEHRTESLPVPEWTGVMHGYELDYVFGMPFNQNFTKQFFPYTPSEEGLSEDMMKFWANFAKTGNPNQPEGTRNVREQIPTWPPYQIGNRSHIVLETKTGAGYKVGENLRRRQCNFWRYQIRNINNYIQSQAVPCPTEPKKSTQDPDNSTSLRGAAFLVLLLSAASVTMVTIGARHWLI